MVLLWCYDVVVLWVSGAVALWCRVLLWCCIVLVCVSVCLLLFLFWLRADPREVQVLSGRSKCQPPAEDLITREPPFVLLGRVGVEAQKAKHTA